MTTEPMYDSDKAIASSELDGWLLGYVGIPWPGPWPKKCGDLFVMAPDGSQAGLAWESQGPTFKPLLGASDGRWGVYQVLFSEPVMSENDLVKNFHLVLPLLKKAWREAQPRLAP